MSRQYGRDQKYHRRKRYIYALFFRGMRMAYIGQTVDPVQREKQHRTPSGGWLEAPFEFVVLHTMEGTHADAEHYEFAYRWKAHRHGWGLYARPHVRIHRIKRHLTLSRRLLAWRVPWPHGHTLNAIDRILRPMAATVVTGVGAFAVWLF